MFDFSRRTRIIEALPMFEDLLETQEGEDRPQFHAAL
jgi:hypothetical protein